MLRVDRIASRVSRTAVIFGIAGYAVLMPANASAQEAVTVSGHVSTGNMPLQNATVRIPSLDVGGMTDENGRYSFIVPSSRVRGQRATMTARHVRYVTQSAEVTLVGGSLVRDFDLPPVTAGTPASASDIQQRVLTSPPAFTARAPMLLTFDRAIVDSSAFGEAVGPLDLPAALAGRVAGLVVTSGSAVGGSSVAVIRGWRTLNGASQPLYVVDGTPIDNSTITTAGQRFGFGGFDYGSTIQDLNLGDIATVQVLTGPAAAMLYGGRAANGVILISTKTGRGLNGFTVSASQQVTFDTPAKLPEFQNAYGQGLAGKFAFFNGTGGGLNDAVAENWGPALQGQPVSQASLTESKRADVRPWVAHPDNVSGYFESGNTLTTNVAAQASNDRATIRVSANNRSFSGVTVGSSVVRRGLGLTTVLQPVPALTANATLQYVSDQGKQRPGSGFDESNPVSSFMLLGRQVDVAALRDHLRDATDNPISWNYAGHNNPYFVPLLNTNKDDQSRLLGGFGVSYALNPSITVAGHVGADSYDATRAFTVARGWSGGFPYFNGRGDFPEGGRENQLASVSQKTVEGAVHLTPGGATSRVAFSVGASWRSNSFSLHDTVVVDTSATVANQPKLVTPSRFVADDNGKSVFGAAQFRLEDYAVVTAMARNEWSSVYSTGHESALYPSVLGTMDLKRAVGSVRDNHTISAARLRAGLSRAGNDLTGYLLRSMYAGNQTSDNLGLSSGPSVAASTALEPEATTAIEVGGSVEMYTGRLAFDLALYNESTSNLIAAVTSQSSAVPTNLGNVSNKGLEATVAVTPVLGRGVRWDVAANYAHNSSSVGSLSSGGQAIPLSPLRWGAGLEARKGEPYAAIVGNGFLRDKSGRLILSKGRPLPDTLSGRKVLGYTAPGWSGGITNSVRYGWLEMSALVSARMGGKIFSATNLWGATSGSLDETAFRPDTGLLISGIDAVTGAANTQHVTTEEYYHALRAIPERWVYDASVVKLREARISVTVPLHGVPGFRAQSLRGSVIGRNLLMWTKAPNIDPETAVSTSTFQGFELGQLPTTRSLGFQLTITP